MMFLKCWLIKHHVVCVLLFREVNSREVLNMQGSGAFVKRKGEKWMTFSPLTAACWLNRPLNTEQIYTHTHTHTHTLAVLKDNPHTDTQTGLASCCFARGSTVIVFWLVFITVCSKLSRWLYKPSGFPYTCKSLQTFPPEKPFKE